MQAHNNEKMLELVYPPPNIVFVTLRQSDSSVDGKTGELLS